jgi:DNA-binding GntR family transcriptional regulator
MSKAAEDAYQTIREMVLTGTLQPGDPLKEEQLAVECGVSRTPVRDALQKLETELYVVRKNGRCFVPDWSNEDMDDMYALWAMLEGYAAARAAERLTPTNLEKMSKYLQGAGHAIGSVGNGNSIPDVETFIALLREYHRVFVEAAGSERLTGLLFKLVDQPMVLRTFFWIDKTELAQIHAQHEELLKAFENRDPVWARAVITAHIQRTLFMHKSKQAQGHAKSRRRHAEE